MVHKFGGTSVGNAQRYQGVAKIVDGLRARAPLAVVVSAMKGVTDDLIRLVDLARRRDDSWTAGLQAIKKRHLEAISELLGGEARQSLSDRLELDFRDIGEVVRGVWLVKTCSERVVELISGYGEVWSAQLLNALLREKGMPSRWLDAREVLVVDPLDHSVVVDWDASARKLKAWREINPGELLVVTGFVASTAEGVATTLKRNGSDFSASIFGALLNASEIVIWTDVDGVLSADPRLVPEAVALNELSYNEVTELAYFGAKVVHPATVEPAIRRGIPIWIRNTFNPDFPGTKIHANAKSELPVKGFSAIEGLALINIEGTGMIGVPGVAERLFGALRSADVSVVMISQASSEHSICFAIPEHQALAAKAAAEKAFYAEIDQGQIQRVDVTPGCSILAIVGDNMVEHPGLAGRFFGALGQAGINVRAIAQGSSERNISAVIAQADTTRALRSVHAAFFLSNQTLSVGLVGAGLIGKEFLRQLQQQLENLRGQRKIDIRVRGIMNSKAMLLEDRQIDLTKWEGTLKERGTPADLRKFTEHLRGGHLPHSVIIDATASAEIPAHYPEWLRAGFNIVTPNKKANASALSRYQELRAAARDGHRYFLYSTNVGAGLPILQTLRDLHQTGDRVLAIEGVFSGTLSFIFNSFTGERPFSEIVKEAKARGYTEPDPRDDLSGMDVARKLVILARETGLRLELEDVRVESLVPAALRSGSIDDYLTALPTNDRGMTELLKRALDQDMVPRYVGAIDAEGRATVALKSYAKTHPFARIQGSDNIVAFRTARYDRQPLYIQGPGAGPEVTAAGVFADLLRLASYLGAPQ